MLVVVGCLLVGWGDDMPSFNDYLLICKIERNIQFLEMQYRRTPLTSH